MVVAETRWGQHLVDWHLVRVTREDIAEVRAKLAPISRPYPSKVAKVLGLIPQQRLAMAIKIDAEAHMEEIASLLEVRSCT